MAELSDALKRLIDREAAEAARNDKIHCVAFEAGIIATIVQKEIGTRDGILAMDSLYIKELIRQALKGSTGSTGKRFDEGNRVLMALARGYSMRINDFSCRMQGSPDIVVKLANNRRIQVEIKTGQGELAKGVSIGDTLEALKDFATSESYIVWYYDVREYNTIAYSLDAIDDMPYIFMKKCDLFAALAEYNGELDTWLKVTEKAVNFQAVTTSAKKLRFLESIAWNKSFDWIECRDRGELVEK